MPFTVPRGLSGQYVCTGAGLVHVVTLTEGRAPSYRDHPNVADATNLISFGSSILAFGDGMLAHELGAGLDTMRPVDLAGARRTLTAHPKIDPITGELHLLTFPSDESQLLVSVSAGGLTRTIRSIDNAPNRIRQLALRDDDVVLLADGFVGLTGRSGDANATWFPIDTDARHLAICHAHDEHVVVMTAGPRLVRWVLHRRTEIVHSEVLDATPQVFATHNPRPSGAMTKYLWTVGSGAVHKHDLLTGTRRSHDFGSHRYPGEFAFVVDEHRRTAEDGGWLVGFVQDEATRETDFVVLDAHAIEGPAVCVAHIPRRVARRAHGTWIPTVQI